MGKRLLASLGLSIALLAVGSIVAAAPSEEEFRVVPYYKYVSATTTSLSIESGGLSYSGGTLKIFEDLETSITLTLQKRSANSSSWSNVNSWTDSFTGKGSHSLEKKYYVSSGYVYRVMNTVKVISKGSVLESINSYSQEEKY